MTACAAIHLFARAFLGALRSRDATFATSYLHIADLCAVPLDR